MTDTAIKLAQFVSGTTPANVPSAALERTALNVMDTIASSAGGYATRNAREMRAAAAALFGEGRSSIWFSGSKTHKGAAILANCAAASALDIDDGHRGASGHPGASIVPAVLQACADAATNITSGEMLTACALGYDVACRIAAARPPSTVKTYSSGRWVGYGVAAALGWLHRQPAETIAHAMTIAGAESPENLPAGSYRRMSSVKGSSPWSTLTAMVALERAKAGADGPLDSLDRTGVFDASQITRDLGSRWEVAYTYIKPYASCRYTHAAMDAVLALVEGTPIRVADIQEVVVEVFPEAFTITNETSPLTLEGAQFSIPFSVALAALRGAAAFRPMRPEVLKDKDVVALSRKIKIREGEEFRMAFPKYTPSRVSLKVNGIWRSETVTHPLGDVDNPMPWSAVEQKLRDLSSQTEAPIRCKSENIISACRKIAENPSWPVSKLLTVLA
ncbi:MmgE/PrpD family protein [Cupriavidus sp. LEh25]|nr:MULTISPECIES: MmgE/PrpD family protein [unclassified Cupriavidus]MBP0625301.1 MmgE/PrpD family protein [Cupriavidus sp. LEh25]MDK2662037.1 MmgE/PrpD family protein [Cupriavidus sp. LEh21]